MHTNEGGHVRSAVDHSIRICLILVDSLNKAENVTKENIKIRKEKDMRSEVYQNARSLILLVLFTFFVTINIKITVVAECIINNASSSSSSSSYVVADCMEVDGGEEFLTDWEIVSDLAPKDDKYITPPVVKYRLPICTADRYQSCLPQPSNPSKLRKCRNFMDRSCNQ